LAIICGEVSVVYNDFLPAICNIVLVVCGRAPGRRAFGCEAAPISATGREAGKAA
jgi:hypothetical protein